MTQQYMLNETAKILGIRGYQIAYAIQQGYLPEPIRIANQRIFNDHDIERIREYFANKHSKGRPAKEAHE